MAVDYDNCKINSILKEIYIISYKYNLFGLRLINQTFINHQWTGLCYSTLSNKRSWGYQTIEQAMRIDLRSSWTRNQWYPVSRVYQFKNSLDKHLFCHNWFSLVELLLFVILFYKLSFTKMLLKIYTYRLVNKYYSNIFLIFYDRYKKLINHSI